MKNTPARVLLPAGEFTLSRNQDGRLVWRGAGPDELAQPEPSCVMEWDGCVDEQGDFHLIMHTASRHLIYCRTSDGRRWSRQSLARLDREDVHLEDLLIAAAPELNIVYLLTGAAPDPVAVRYRRGAHGAWQGRRLELPHAGRLHALVSLLPSSQGPVLYASYNERDRGRFFRIPLDTGPAVELFSAPGPMESPQAITDEAGALHTVFISRGRVFADNYPLEEEPDCDSPCLYSAQGQIRCAFRLHGQWISRRLGSSGWEPTALSANPAAPPIAEIAARSRQLTPPFSQAPAAPSSAPPAAAQPAPSGSGLTQTLRNQALLLSQLQQSFREMQQQLFAVSAQSKACAAQEKAIATLKDRCTQLENGMAVLEEMIAKQ